MAFFISFFFIEMLTTHYFHVGLWNCIFLATSNESMDKTELSFKIRVGEMHMLFAPSLDQYLLNAMITSYGFDNTFFPSPWESYTIHVGILI